MDPLFRKAEKMAAERALFPHAEGRDRIEGLLSPEEVTRATQVLRTLDVDEYIRRTVAPSEDPRRAGVRAVLSATSWKRLEEWSEGPFYAAVYELSLGGRLRKVGFVGQDRRIANGVWGPEHHQRAAEMVRDFADRLIPIVTLIDTPGASPSATANRANQAHTISRLIAEMAQIHVPTVGVVLGKGYSGGAIHLATVNMLLSVRDGVFNTIQPQGLANIVRAYDLSWEQCAKSVGVSAYELFLQGHLDGVIDFVPGESGPRLRSFERAIESSIESVEAQARDFVRREPAVFEHYQKSMLRFVEPSTTLRAIEEVTELSSLGHPTAQTNVFGVSYRYLRYLGMRRRLSSTTVERYGRLSSDEVPRGGRSERLELERAAAFLHWLENPLDLRYDDMLKRVYERYRVALDSLGAVRGRLASFLLGTREADLERARAELLIEISFHLHNLWKEAAQDNFARLSRFLAEVDDSEERPSSRHPTVLDVITHPSVRAAFTNECENLICFDRVYNGIFEHLRSIASEAKDANFISRESIEQLVVSALGAALDDLAGSGDNAQSERLRLQNQFRSWLGQFATYPRRGELLKSVSEWKRLEMPRVSEPLFAIVTFLFEKLLPSYYDSAEGSGVYDGRISPRNIGVRDFWSRLEYACQDLLIEDILIAQKRATPRDPRVILDHFFDDVEEYDARLMTRDPVTFPGFRVSIEQALDRGITPCGTVAAIGRLKSGQRRRVGILVSNLAFQAGSFDMASAQKFSRLLVRCAAEQLPVVCFISSGGMQTKEGAGALFSMPVINDRITRFIRDTDLPVVVFGFGDCTGGAQASIVTHSLVATYYFSGTNMPFAGQIVVPEHLPMTSTLSNYLSQGADAMQGLVKHPFGKDLDDLLRSVDPKIPVASETVEDVLARELDTNRRVEFLSQRRASSESDEPVFSSPRFRPTQRVLIHARGCTAVKLVRVAKRQGIEVVLVQSDPDMDSVAADMLGDRDALVCIGGSTPEESYLNAASVIRVAAREHVDSLHPGIGFLSESASFAELCRQNDLNFVGPSSSSMQRMGNKSNAIQTALRLGVPVIPGSHGILTDSEAAHAVARSIGFPVMIKAVHGGGGVGICRVDREEDFDEAFSQTRAAAGSAFGNRDCYIEKLVVSMRHVEVQLLRDRLGNFMALGLRDCSVQRNNQKVLEESDSTALSPELRDAAFRFARAIADEIDYIGAGTVEFIFDLETQSLYFMEMNTRLQVEHPVTEVTSGVDIVRAQFDIASGASIGEYESGDHGYGLEARINAERPVWNAEGKLELQPAPGTVTHCAFPSQEGIEVISAIQTGSVVSPYYDSLVAQVICHGADRADAISKLESYLGNVAIEGIETNLALVCAVLADEVFRAGEFDTRYLDTFLEGCDGAALIEQVERSAGKSEAVQRQASIAIEDSDELRVMAPSSGVFYSAATPESPAFASVGDLVDVDQPLCLIEAMKLLCSVSLSSLNGRDELYAPSCRYAIVRVCASNGQTVNAGDLLLVVRPVPAENARAANHR